MNSWAIITFVMVLLFVSGALAYYVELAPMGQVVAVLASVAVAAVGLWMFLKDSLNHEDKAQVSLRQ